jgi:hypothetical protein
VRPWLRLFFIVFFVSTGLAHEFIDEYYFPTWPPWDTSYVVEPIGATKPISLLAAFLLLIPRRSFELCAATVAVALMLIAVPAHAYAATGRLLFNHSAESPIFSTMYIALAVPVTIWLAREVFLRGSSQRIEEKDSKSP